MLNAQFGDREIMNDALSSQKFIAEGYNTGATECACPQLMSVMMNILNEEHQMQHELFTEMQNRGWYVTTPAEQQKVQQAKQKFTMQ